MPLKSQVVDESLASMTFTLQDDSELRFASTQATTSQASAVKALEPSSEVSRRKLISARGEEQLGHWHDVHKKPDTAWASGPNNSPHSASTPSINDRPWARSTPTETRIGMGRRKKA